MNQESNGRFTHAEHPNSNLDRPTCCRSLLYDRVPEGHASYALRLQICVRLYVCTVSSSYREMRISSLVGLLHCSYK